ncbi:MAG: 2-amino-4-hydroxy-6-hydroxymethyldihydropteridine diphosphokinase [Sulfuricaulis sp.]
MSRVHVSVGSNIEREISIRGAVRDLAARYGPLRLSPVYESKAHGFEGANFYNLVVGFDTTEAIERVKESLAHIESQFGRQRQVHHVSSRTLDLDLLLYDDVVRHDERINLPHPDIQRYAFVLRPLAEIAPDLRHPETGETCAKMWAQFGSASQEIWPADFDLQA